MPDTPDEERVGAEQVTKTAFWHEDMAALGLAAVCIGKFDGVHVGHQRVIAETMRHARETSAVSVVVTFDRHPASVVAPDYVPARLMSLEENLRWIEELGPDHIIVVPFTARLAAMSAEQFLESVLLRVMDPVAIVIGQGFRLGRGASHGAECMRRYLAPTGCTVFEVPLVRVGEAAASSTRIRRFVESGDFRAAAHILGRPYESGLVSATAGIPLST
jgi:riboflavin kinase/FMN adenylyltransferase